MWTFERLAPWHTIEFQNLKKGNKKKTDVFESQSELERKKKRNSKVRGYKIKEKKAREKRARSPVVFGPDMVAHDSAPAPFPFKTRSI